MSITIDFYHNEKQSILQKSVKSKKNIQKDQNNQIEMIFSPKPKEVYLNNEEVFTHTLFSQFLRRLPPNFSMTKITASTKSFSGNLPKPLYMSKIRCHNIDGTLTNIFTVYFAQNSQVFMKLHKKSACMDFQIMNIPKKISAASCYRWKLVNGFSDTQPFKLMHSYVINFKKPGFLSALNRDEINLYTLSEKSHRETRILDHTTSINDLVESLPGDKYVIFENESNKQENPFMLNDQKVQQFAWIVPWASSAIDQADYIELDGTFKSCRPFTAFVLQAVRKNTGIPLCLVLTPTESAASFSFAYHCLEKSTNKVDKLRSLEVLADLGSGISSFVTDELNKEFVYACHRHLIENAGSNSLNGSYVKRMLRLNNEEEFTSYLYLINCTFRDSDDPPLGEKESSKLFSLIRKYPTWAKWMRQGIHMSTCSNHAEGFHRVLNKATNCKRSFVTRIGEVVKAIESRYRNIISGKSLQDTYKRRYNKLKDLMKIKIDVKNQKLDDFLQEKCTCAEGNYHRSIYGMTFEESPCICNIGKFQKCPKVEPIQVEIEPSKKIPHDLIEIKEQKFIKSTPWFFAKSKKQRKSTCIISLKNELMALKPNSVFLDNAKKWTNDLFASTHSSLYDIQKAICTYFRFLNIKLNNMSDEQCAIHYLNLDKIIRNPHMKISDINLKQIPNMHHVEDEPDFQKIFNEMSEIFNFFLERFGLNSADIIINEDTLENVYIKFIHDLESMKGKENIENLFNSFLELLKQLNNDCIILSVQAAYMVLKDKLWKEEDENLEYNNNDLDFYYIEEMERELETSDEEDVETPLKNIRKAIPLPIDNEDQDNETEAQKENKGKKVNISKKIITQPKKSKLLKMNGEFISTNEEEIKRQKIDVMSIMQTRSRGKKPEFNDSRRKTQDQLIEDTGMGFTSVKLRTKKGTYGLRINPDKPMNF